MENARLLKEYFLTYASCIYCSKKYSDIQVNRTESDRDTESNIIEKCSDHHHMFSSFFVEQHMIPIIIQQFLIDLDTKSASKIQTFNHTNDAVEERSIDIKEVEQFWNEYLTAIPSDLELIWDTIDNGLNRYLQVIYGKIR